MNHESASSLTKQASLIRHPDALFFFAKIANSSKAFGMARRLIDLIPAGPGVINYVWSLLPSLGRSTMRIQVKIVCGCFWFQEVMELEK